eukprot:Anaeramoba_ignava/a607419_41.p1 GENE.a607419_41~~a607419_41.p1  ORF type:complete len:681 (+),score=237.09 a607419_41:49-2043(+)
MKNNSNKKKTSSEGSTTTEYPTNSETTSTSTSSTSDSEINIEQNQHFFPEFNTKLNLPKKKNRKKPKKRYTKKQINLYNLSKNTIKELLITDVANDIESIYENQKESADLKIFCGNFENPIHCHRLILISRCAFFHAQYRESKSECNIYLPDFDVSVVEPIIRFIYSGKITINFQEFGKFYKLAKFFSLKKLQILIEKEIEPIITYRNAISLYMESREIESFYLIRKCEIFIINNMSILIKKKKTDKLSENQLLSLIELIVSKKDINNKTYLIPVILDNWIEKNTLLVEKLNENTSINYRDPIESQKQHIKEFILQMLIQSRDLQEIPDSKIAQIEKIQRISSFPLNFVFQIINLQMKSLKEKISQEHELQNQKFHIIEEKEKYFAKKEDEFREKERVFQRKKDNLEELAKEIEAKISPNQLKDGSIQQTESQVYEILQIFKKSIEKEMIDQVSIDSVLNFMKKFPLASDIQEISCFILEKIAEEDADDLIKIVDSDGMDLVIDSMNNFPNDPKIQEVAIDAIITFLRKPKRKKYQKKIKEIKGIEAIIKSMNSFPNNKEIQSQGCGALWSISSINIENQEEILRLKGVETIIMSMDKFPNNQEIQENGFGILATISYENKEFFGDQEIEKAIIKTMEKFSINQTILYKGCEFLRNISFNNSKN